ncbi:MAG: PTS fructose transporter subunit IIA [Chromatiales bacterium]|nr:PTS fructose transporter subunit IIA [Chromatiales bacterium]
MSVGLLIITHAPVGSALVEAVFGTIGELPLTTRVLDIKRDEELEQAQAGARTLCDEVDQGEGVLILTDLYGATPSNVATTLITNEVPRMLVSGLNMSMLIRVMNYPDLPLPALVETARGGGHSGIFVYPPLAQSNEINHAQK